ncbi:MAG: GFA family protein [Rhodospirillales bacterium]|nr:GFA family protein [Rhodospirillales bacterium]
MSEGDVFSGGCACGAVRYQCRADPIIATFCQCRACQWDSGGGHSSHLGVAADAVTVTGEVRFWETIAKSGAVTRRGFCPTCGSPMLLTSTGMAGVIFLTAGSLDDPAVFRPSMVVFASEAPAWDAIDPSLPRFAGMPPSRT